MFLVKKVRAIQLKDCECDNIIELKDCDGELKDCDGSFLWHYLLALSLDVDVPLNLIQLVCCTSDGEEKTNRIMAI